MLNSKKEWLEAIGVLIVAIFSIWYAYHYSVTETDERIREYLKSVSGQRGGGLTLFLYKRGGKQAIDLFHYCFSGFFVCAFLYKVYGIYLDWKYRNKNKQKK